MEKIPGILVHTWRFVMIIHIFLVPLLYSQHPIDPLNQIIISPLNGNAAAEIGLAHTQPAARMLSENVIAVQPAWIRHFQNDQVGEDDIAQLLAVDHEGNILVCGYAELGHYGKLITIKYAPNGTQLWSNNYGDSYFPVDIDVDADNNLYIAGMKYSEGHQSDYFTIKYNSAGEFQWETNYEPDNQLHAIAALALDPSGNVWVTGNGQSIGSGRGICTTIKYDPDGKILWKAQIDDPAAISCEGLGITVDKSGYGYVTGIRVQQGTFNADIFLARYCASGELEWYSIFNGQADGDDIVAKMTADETGNLYLTGYTFNSKGNFDYLTIKYNAAGKQIWVATYTGVGHGNDRAADLKIDNRGNVYVTGASFEKSSLTDEDLTTVKYDAAGKQLWVAHFNRNDDRDDSCESGNSLEIDAEQNVYVAGNSSGINYYPDFTCLKYNSNGVQQWVRYYDGVAQGMDFAQKILADPAGNLIITGYSQGYRSNYDIATIKYDSQGETKWIARYNTMAPSVNMASSLLVDQAGNIYVTGVSGDYNFFSLPTVKYDFAGNQLWRTYYHCTNPTTFSYLTGTKMTVDANHNLYVAGTTISSMDGGCVVYKYDPNGIQQWEYIFASNGSRFDAAYDMAIDFDGYVYVTGQNYSGQFVTIKINLAGKLEWVAYFPDSETFAAGSLDVEVDRKGNVYVLGDCEGKMTLVKYNIQGKREWYVQKWPGTTGVKLQLDADDQILVAGSNHDSNYPFNFIIEKYNPQGENIWSAQYLNSDIPSFKMQAMTVDFAGKIYVTGTIAAQHTTLKYNPSGILEWMASNENAMNNNCVPVAIGVDNQGHVYITGNGEGSNTSRDMITIKYDPNGHELWTHRFNYAGQSWDEVKALAIDPSGNVYVAGFSRDNFQSRFTTLKFAAGTTTVAVNAAPQKEADFRLAQNYPNPFNACTTISLTLIKSSFMQLNIYNVSGQCIKSLFQGTKTAGHYSFVWDGTDNSNQMVTSGIYYYQLKTAAGPSKSQKLILLR